MIVRPIFVPTQPKRCTGGEAGLGGACLACGAAAAHACQAPPDERYRPKRRRSAAR